MAKDVVVIRGEFGDYLHALGYAALTIERYQRRLVSVAEWLHKHLHYPPLNELTRRLVACVLGSVLHGRSPETKKHYRKALFHWLRFRGRYKNPVVHPWGQWLSDYLHFLQTHQGVGRSTLDHHDASARAFLEWQFDAGPVDWSTVQPPTIWRFARHYVRGVKLGSGKSRLGCLRRFLRFVYLRGACGPQLAAAIPKLAVYGEVPRRTVLSEQQRRLLLTSFSRTSPQGKRDYAMTLCMLDLGFRGGEVIGLRLQDIDWQRRQLTIEVTKTGRGRQLPIPDRVLKALRDYVENGRPEQASSDRVFVRHSRRSGHPLTRSTLKQMLKTAYRHCGFPAAWTGTHRLRHTFASRLHQRGVDMKSIADLLGHRQLDSTNIYTQVDLQALRALAQPWPR